MAARVMLLFLAVGLFVAAWSSDHRPGRSEPDESAAVATQREIALAVSGGAARGELQHAAEASRLAFETAAESATTIRRRPHPMVAPPRIPVEAFVSVDRTPANYAPVPLPGGMTPGRYRVVRSDGQTLRLDVSQADLRDRGLPQGDSPRNCYLLHDGTLRWYFIRIDRPRAAADAPAARVRETVSAACHNVGESRIPAVARKPFLPTVACKPRSAAARQWASRKQFVPAPAIGALTQTIVEFRRLLWDYAATAIDRWWQQAFGCVQQIHRSAARASGMSAR